MLCLRETEEKVDEFSESNPADVRLPKKTPKSTATTTAPQTCLLLRGVLFYWLSLGLFVGIGYSVFMLP